MMRLHRYLAMCGAGSRRKCEELIDLGRVTLNGAVAGIGESVDENADEVRLDGAVMRMEERKRYIALFKPAGVISSAHDPQGRRTVVSLVGADERIFPVGRLDFDTEGLILLTNDGEFANRLTHPSKEVEKLYFLRVDAPPTEVALRRLRSGVPVDGRLTAPARARVLNTDRQGAWLEMVIHEGRNRQIKKMLEAVHLKVLYLRREAVGCVTTEGLSPGEWRELTPDEVRALCAN